MKKLKFNKKLLILFTILIFLFIIFVISTFFSIINMNKTTILNNVKINDVDISNLSKEQATEKLENLINSKQTAILNYNANDQNYDNILYYSTIAVNYDIATAVNQAYNLGRTGNIFQNNFINLKLLFKPQNIKINISFNNDELNNFIDDISANLPDKLVKTDYSIEDENLIIQKGKSGTTVDSDLFNNLLNSCLENISTNKDFIQIPVKYKNPENIDINKIHDEIYQKSQDAYYEKSPFKVHAEIVGIDFDVDKAKKKIEDNPADSEYTIKLDYSYPKKTLENLNINIFPDLLGSFSTRYDASKKDRSNNLEIAAKKINGTIISPGKEFSYNKIVGARTIQNRL